MSGLLQCWFRVAERWNIAGILLVVLSTIISAQGQCPTAACVPGNASVANLAFGMGIFRVQLAGLDTTTNGAADGYRN